MGAGIAVALLDAGLPVVMVEQDDAALARGRQRVEHVYDLLAGKGLSLIHISFFMDLPPGRDARDTNRPAGRRAFRGPDGGPGDCQRQ